MSYTTELAVYPTRHEHRLEPFREIDELDPVFVNVPVQVIREIINAHAGLHQDSGELPPMEKQDDAGHLYAAALPNDMLPDTPPPTHSTSTTSSQHTPITFDSPEIMGHRAPAPNSPHTAPTNVSDMI